MEEDDISPDKEQDKRMDAIVLSDRSIPGGGMDEAAAGAAHQQEQEQQDEEVVQPTLAAHPLTLSYSSEDPQSPLYSLRESSGGFRSSRRSISPSTILTNPSQEPLISSIRSYDDDNDAAEGEKRLLSPRITTRIHSMLSDDADALDSVFDEALLNAKKLHEQKKPPHQAASSNKKKPTVVELWDVTKRSSSSPRKSTSLSRFRSSPAATPQQQRTSTPTVSNQQRTRQQASPVAIFAGGGGHSSSGTSNYAFNSRRLSLPSMKNATRAGSPHVSTAVAAVAAAGINDDDDEDDDSLSSMDEEITMLAKELSTPKRKKERQNIFRSVRTTSSRKRASQQTNSTDSTSPAEEADEVQKKQQSALNRVNTVKTFEDDAVDTAMDMTVNDADNNNQATRRRPPTPLVSPLQLDVEASERSAASTRELGPMLQRRGFHYALYLSTFACFGTIVRVYMGRLFGQDCEAQEEAVQDWLTPLSRHICITSSGLTQQMGGALFTDLPANMFGSFLMGLLNGLAGPPLPWLPSNHPLQQHTVLHVAIRTGMCGSLTTFASWNTQLVTMLDGSTTELEQQQIATALFGYMLGLIAAISSFQCGNHFSAFWNRYSDPPSIWDSTHDSIDHRGNSPVVMDHHSSFSRRSERSNNDVSLPDEEIAIRRKSEAPPPIILFPELGFRRSGLYQQCKALLSGRTIAFVVLAAFLSCFILADLLMDIPFYRALWLEVLLTPAGAMLRWTLALKFNTAAGRPGFEWVPWGTLVANLLGSCISLVFAGIDYRYSLQEGTWSHALSMAVRVGFAGSLSTVSTFAKEIVDLSTFYSYSAKGYIYGLSTLICAMLLGFACFAPIVRL